LRKNLIAAQSRKRGHPSSRQPNPSHVVTSSIPFDCHPRYGITLMHESAGEHQRPRRFEPKKPVACSMAHTMPTDSELHALALFGTAIGQCALVWNDHGIAAVRLPEASEARMLSRLHSEFSRLTPATPPPDIQQAIEAMSALLGGGALDLRFCTLDLRHTPPFHRRVYAITQDILPGKTSTYGDIAAQLGEPGSARAVGQALGRNPFPIIVPCHRVLASGAQSGGFSAPGGVSTKLRMLLIEGAEIGGAPGLFDREPPRPMS
jgi:methylated-DNA-[protein]-cysteine S-methyltransferase